MGMWFKKLCYVFFLFYVYFIILLLLLSVVEIYWMSIVEIFPYAD